MKENCGEIWTEVEEILEECRQIRQEIREKGKETDRKLDENNKVLLSLLKRSKLDHGER